MAYRIYSELSRLTVSYVSEVLSVGGLTLAYMILAAWWVWVGGVLGDLCTHCLYDRRVTGLYECHIPITPYKCVIEWLVGYP